MKRLMALIMGLMMLSVVATTTSSTSPTVQKLNQMPVAFTKNMGQWDDRVLFRADAGGATMWFTKEGVTYQFTRNVGRGTRRVSAALGVPDSSWANAVHPNDLENELLAATA